MAKIRARYEVEWQELTLDAKLRKQAEDAGGPLYEHNRDADEQNHCKPFGTLLAAQAHAKKVVATGKTVYGHATVQRQEYLPIEGTIYFDWEPVGEPEYIS